MRELKRCLIAISTITFALIYSESFAETQKCETKKAEVLQKIEAIKLCQRDSECALVSFNCPFGCGTPVNSQADIEKVFLAVDDYRMSCNKCVYDCTVEKSDLRCINQKCAIVPPPPVSVTAKKELREKLLALQKKMEELSAKLNEKMKKGSETLSEKSENSENTLRDQLEALQTQTKILLKQLDEQRKSSVAEAQDKLSEVITKLGKKLEEVGEGIKSKK